MPKLTDGVDGTFTHAIEGIDVSPVAQAPRLSEYSVAELEELAAAGRVAEDELFRRGKR